METPTNSRLPLDIIVEILLLLPSDSILACKLVCKAWRNLIKDSMFIKLYKVESTTMFFLRRNNLHCLTRRDDAGSYTVRHICTISDIHDSYNESLYQHHLFSETSNKIACVKFPLSNFFLLYNLLTGDSRVVDYAPEGPSLFVGFGYDLYEDDYKILMGWRSKFGSTLQLDDDTKCIISVYSYRNNCWKLVDGFYEDSWPRLNICIAYYFNGRLHWPVGKRGKATSSTEMRVLAALDVHSYEFVELELPPTFSSYEPTLVTEFDGCLCCAQYQSNGIGVWVMKEYGVEESWTKLFSVCSSRISAWRWVEMFYAAFRLYKCEDEGKVVVFLQTVNEPEMLFRYGIHDGETEFYLETPRLAGNLVSWLWSMFCRKECC